MKCIQYVKRFIAIDEARLSVVQSRGPQLIEQSVSFVRLPSLLPLKYFLVMLGPYVGKLHGHSSRQWR